jgi:hypothetical protein
MVSSTSRILEQEVPEALEALLAAAKKATPSPEQQEEQRRSFAYGNTGERRDVAHSNRNSSQTRSNEPRRRPQTAFVSLTRGRLRRRRPLKGRPSSPSNCVRP